MLTYTGSTLWCQDTGVSRSYHPISSFSNSMANKAISGSIGGFDKKKGTVTFQASTPEESSIHSILEILCV